jgi:isoleucyl-tRNA synthetase
VFDPVNSKVNFPSVEEKVLQFWKENQIFERSMQLREKGSRFVMYEGPPTANGKPGIHHVLSRVFKDVIPRYKTMKGFNVPRKAGWDTHGLPVELEVEESLGFTSKDQIEEYGVAEFNARCRESVMRYLEDWDRLTERIGFWVDLEHPYITFQNGYIESLWWAIKQLWDKDLIYQGYRVTPHCPRCGTSLSSHEVALGYEEADDPSIYIKFEVAKSLYTPTFLDNLRVGGYAREADFAKQLMDLVGDKPVYLLAWTTTPWTLPGNTALAVAPKDDYSLMEGIDDYLIMASALVNAVGLDNYREVRTFSGSDLVQVRYEPLFNPHEFGITPVAMGEPSSGPSADTAFRPEGLFNYPVISADFVSMEDGTGIVHTAPAFGEVDYEAGKEGGLDFVRDYVDLQGIIQGTYNFAGKFVKDADPLILEDLKSRGLLYRSEIIRHTYPFCWRCATPLLYYAKPSWYIRTTAKKQRLISGNEEISWYPEHIKRGRFGDWLENNVDWGFSRERYWGTPLNIWQCEVHPEHRECIGSVEELRDKPGVEGLDEPLDLHRPFVDQITFRCSQCGGRMQRVPEVLDAWFDSGSMPIAQWHYPFENQSVFEENFPADYICEAVDQTRGWFYTLHSVSTLLFDGPCFKNVICLGHILDAEGEKMSKTRGNVVDPWTILDSQGADALRWYMFTATPPGNVRRFSPDQVTEVMRRFFMTWWNTYSFFVMYANIDGFDPSKVEISAFESELDRWILSELNQLIDKVDTVLDGYNPTEAARRIEQFVDYLSNWYVRRGRRRFWKSESDADKLAAYCTLYRCLVTLAKLAAPFAPFVAEEIYRNLVKSVYHDAPESVHLCDFPASDPSMIDERLGEATRLAMKISSMGRSARSRSGIKVRQPLSRAIVKTRYEGEHKGLERLAPQILDELNVKAMEFVGNEDELMAQEGYSVVVEEGYAVAIDVSISPELKEEGMAREVVHRLQMMRRNAGFDIADRIVTFYQGDASLHRTMESFSSYIKQETLSDQLVEGVPEDGVHVEDQRISGESVTLGVKRVRG